MINFSSLIINLAISMFTGILSAFLTRGETEMLFDKITKAPLTPAPAVFPIVWTVLFFLMGISGYIIWESKCKTRNVSLKIYALQLIFNFFWPIIFFKFEEFDIAFFWIILLLITVIIMVELFLNCSKKAGYLQIPYVIWLIFASYLNFSVCVLN